MHLDQNPEAALGGFGKDFDDDGREKRTGSESFITICILST